MKRPSDSSRRSRSSHGLRGTDAEHRKTGVTAANRAKNLAEDGQCERAFLALGSAASNEMWAGQNIPELTSANYVVRQYCEARRKRSRG